MTAPAVAVGHDHAPMDHWVRELAAFDRHRAADPTATYASWQPTKWQSLLTVRDLLLQRCWDGAPGPAATALELGCGSSTLMLQLQQAGVRGTGVDRDPGARAMTEAAAASLGVDAPPVLDLDFFDPAAALPVSDLVFHVGVIEHFDAAEQLRLLQLSAALSRRWVLIGIPHEHGPVFEGFLKAVTAGGSVYDHDHQPIDVPALVQQAGYRLAAQDGAHLFYSTPDLYVPGDPRLDDLYARLGPALVAAGGDRYASFPRMAFGAEDIDVLRRVEESLTPAQRYDAAFLRLYLIDVGAGPDR